MRVMIWADMEGVAGITSWDHVGGSSPLYHDGRKLYTGEINAAVRGCKKAGADEIIVIDGHGGGFSSGRGFLSLIAEDLEPGAEYVLGYTWARYVEPFEQGCDAALFVGAHAMAGTPDGVLSHTVSSESWYTATINGTAVGESGIVAAIAGSWDVPCIFVSGDEATCREVQTLLGSTVVAAPVKKGLARFAARHKSPADACALIEAKSAEALSHRENWPRPLTFTAPVTFQVELAAPDHAASYRGRAGVEVIGPRSVRARGDNFWHAWDQFWYRM
ncbi:MAG TPA: M55 family metallopeptidase [Armatimonadota bacterium]|nr:M55 family metallopeptidase [Armatimonadota bacterium]